MKDSIRAASVNKHDGTQMALDWTLLPTAFVVELMKESFVMTLLSTHLLLQIATPLWPLPINIVKV